MDIDSNKNGYALQLLTMSKENIIFHDKDFENYNQTCYTMEKSQFRTNAMIGPRYY